jgi:hypothetical protein
MARYYFAINASRRPSWGPTAKPEVREWKHWKKTFQGPKLLFVWYFDKLNGPRGVYHYRKIALDKRQRNFAGPVSALSGLAKNVDSERGGGKARASTAARGTRTKKLKGSFMKSCPTKVTTKRVKGGPWIQKAGKLGGPGYTDRSDRERRHILKCGLGQYGYRSMMGSLQVLTRGHMSKKHMKVVERDIAWMKEHKP